VGQTRLGAGERDVKREGFADFNANHQLNIARIVLRFKLAIGNWKFSNFALA